MSEAKKGMEEEEEREEADEEKETGSRWEERKEADQERETGGRWEERWEVDEEKEETDDQREGVRRMRGRDGGRWASSRSITSTPNKKKI